MVYHIDVVFIVDSLQHIQGAVVTEGLRQQTSRPELPGSIPGLAVAPLGKALLALNYHCLVLQRRL